MSAIFTAILSAILFGVSTPICKYLLNGISEFQLAGLLYLGAALGVLPIILSDKKVHSFKGIGQNNIFKIIGAIVFGGILGPVFLLFALKMALASSVSLWLNLEVVVTAILGVIFFKDHLDRNGWIGVIGAVSAGILLSYQEGTTGLVAGVLILFACICWGLDNHLTATIDGITATQTTFLKGLFAGIFNLTVGMAISNTLPSSTIIIGSLVVGFFTYGVSIILYITAAQSLGATRSQIVFSSAPFFGLLFSWILLNEQLTPVHYFSAALMAISILLISNLVHEHTHVHEATTHTHYHAHDDHHRHDHDEIPAAVLHTHEHTHLTIKHAHQHYPDLHHRHDH